MPPQRRSRLYIILTLVAIVIFIYMSRGARQTRTSDFYKKTQQALVQNQHEEAQRQQSAESVGLRLKAAGEQAKQAAYKKSSWVKDAVQGPDQKDVAGRVKMNDEKVPDVAQQGVRSGYQAVIHEETLEEHEAEQELNLILKQSPVVIFSKSYCPFSKKAKHILLEKYKIVPEPHVIELDIHEQGVALQALLAKLTGRTTVPNILIMGKSIGGGDDMEELDDTNTLIAKIKEMGGSRFTAIEYRGTRGRTRLRQA